MTVWQVIPKTLRNCWYQYPIFPEGSPHGDFALFASVIPEDSARAARLQLMIRCFQSPPQTRQDSRIAATPIITHPAATFGKGKLKTLLAACTPRRLLHDNL